MVFTLQSQHCKKFQEKIKIKLPKPCIFIFYLIVLETKTIAIRLPVGDIEIRPRPTLGIAELPNFEHVRHFFAELSANSSANLYCYRQG